MCDILFHLVRSRNNPYQGAYMETRPSSDLEAATMYKLKGRSLNKRTGLGFKYSGLHATLQEMLQATLQAKLQATSQA